MMMMISLIGMTPISKGGNLQLTLGGQNRRKAPKNFLVPQKLSFGGTNVHQCSVNKQIFFNEQANTYPDVQFCKASKILVNFVM